jgi:hypothetical protein
LRVLVNQKWTMNMARIRPSVFIPTSQK